MDALEAFAFALTLGMVVCNVRQIHWGWLLAILASLVYGVVFYKAKLYGEMVLQSAFVVLAAWGWWQWLRGFQSEKPLKPAWMVRDGNFKMLFWSFLAWALLWWICAQALARVTDSDTPAFDGFTTSGSVVAQVLLGLKYRFNWWIWLVVNVASVGLFVSKGLWLTAALYALLAVLSVAGWWAWRRRLS